MQRLLPLLIGILICVVALAAPKTPRPLANITLAAPPFGKTVKLSTYAGKVMVIVVFDTQCSSCATAVRYLDRIQKEYQGKNVVMIAGAANPAAVSYVRPFIDRYKITIPVGVLSEDDARRLTDYGPTERLKVPALLFVDKKGMVRTQVAGDSPFFKAGSKNIHTVIDGLLRQ